MPTQPPRHHSIAAKECVLLLAVGIVVSLVVVPAILRTRVAAARNQCHHNLKLLGFAAHQYHDVHGTLPPSRIAPGYATWVVLVSPFLPSGQEFLKWDLTKPYGEQPKYQLIHATIPALFCPVRRTRPHLSQPGIDVLPDGRDLPGRSGDYAGVAGGYGVAGNIHEDDGNGCIILAWSSFRAEKLDHWRGRVSLAQVLQGTSNALMLGERHVPIGTLNADAGDGCIYNGYLPYTAVRIAGPGPTNIGYDFDLAQSSQDRTGGPVRWQRIFGSAHPEGIVPFCMADGSIRKLRPSIPAVLLQQLAFFRPEADPAH